MFRNLNNDEIGIRNAWYGRTMLKTAYQPVFRHRGGMLVPEAVEALVRPYREGSPVAPQTFFATVRPEDRLHVEVLCRDLHLANHPNLGEPGVAIYFNYDPRANGDLPQALDELNRMAEGLAQTELDIRLLVCEITESDCLDRDDFVRLAAEIRRLGMRLAIDDFGAGHSTPDRVQMIEPDVVKVDGAFFRRVASIPEALRLLPALVRCLREGGADVLVEGIETPSQLAAAIDSGADLVQGYLLGRPELAGAWFDTEPRSLARYLDPPEVVQLFAR